MKTPALDRAALALCITFVCIISLDVNVYSAESTRRDIEILNTWSGDYPVDKLELLPDSQDGRTAGCIKDAQTFAAVWKIFKPDVEIPEIDFEHNLVLFIRNTQFYNLIRIGRVLTTSGIAEIIAMETMSAMPIENKVGLSLAVVAREGIKGIRTGNDIIELPNK
jgi:hypothetical protein